MTTGKFIKLLQEIDPSGKMELVVNAGCYDSPVMPSTPHKATIDEDEWEWEDEGTEVISFCADN